MLTVESITHHVYLLASTVPIDASVEVKGAGPGHIYWGISQDFRKENKWFAGLFFENGKPTVLYFNHDEATIIELYKQHKNIQPGEPPLKKRSKIFIDDNTDAALVYGLITTSHQQTLLTLPKGIQKRINEIAGHPNQFPFFNRIVEELCAEDKNWQYDSLSPMGGNPSVAYSDMSVPKRVFVCAFRHNQLLLSVGAEEGIGPDRKAEWKDIILKTKETKLIS